VLAADAKELNHAMGSRGRGNFRYLFDPERHLFVGIAEHIGNDYKKAD